jgi:hypothetical protein
MDLGKSGKLRRILQPGAAMSIAAKDVAAGAVIISRMNIRSRLAPATLLAGFCALLLGLLPLPSVCAVTEVQMPVLIGDQAATLKKVGLVVRAPSGTATPPSSGSPVLVALPGPGFSPAAAAGVSLVTTAMVGGVTMLVDHINQGYLAEIFDTVKLLDYEATLGRTLAARATPTDISAPLLLPVPWP